MKIMQKGSYTIEAAVYIPMMMFLILITLRGGISFYQKSKEIDVEIRNIDIVKEFYTYQMIKETGEEWEDD